MPAMGDRVDGAFEAAFAAIIVSEPLQPVDALAILFGLAKAAWRSFRRAKSRIAGVANLPGRYDHEGARSRGTKTGPDASASSSGLVGFVELRMNP